MKKIIVMAIAFFLLLGFSGKAVAGVRVGIGIPLPPPFVFAAPPELVVIPGSYVYYCPDASFDIFFYDGYWYRPFEGYWYRSEGYSGPWVYIVGPPSVLLRLPPDYWIVTRGYRHIPYGELHRNWRAWERGRYWEQHNWGRDGHPEQQRYHGMAPSFRERSRGGSNRGHAYHGSGSSHAHNSGGGIHGGSGHGARGNR